MGNKFQNEDFKTSAELISAGGTVTQLLNTTRVYSPKSASILETTLRKNNFAGTIAPSVTNDLSQGYEVGSVWIDTVAQKTYNCISNTNGAALWKEGGSGDGLGGDLSSFVSLTAIEDLALWSTGDNATFLGAGALSGTFVKETVAPLNGNASYKYTQAANSLNDYLASPIQAVPVRFRGNTNSLLLNYLYDGAATDIAAVVYDVTNGTKLTDDTVNLLQTTGINSSQYKANIFIPLNCTQIRVGFHVKALNSGKILSFDDVQVSADVTKYLSISNNTGWQDCNHGATQGLGTLPSASSVCRRVGSDLQWRMNFQTGTVTSSEIRIDIPQFNGQTLTIASGTGFSTRGRFNRSSNILSASKVGPVIGASGNGYIGFSFEEEGLTFNPLVPATGTAAFASSANYSFEVTLPIAGWEDSTANIVTATESVSSDTIAFAYANAATYTLATLPNAPIGTYITFTVAASSNTRVQTTGVNRPTQTDANMGVNGINMFSKTYGTASTFGNPALVAVQIGKGYKACQVNIFKSIGKTNVGTLDFSYGGNAAEIANGMVIRTYDETTGILVLDNTFIQSTITSSRFFFSDGTVQSSGYVTFNASKNPSLVGITTSPVAANYNSTSGQSITNTLALFNYEITDYDTRSSYSSGIYTAPETGIYLISASFGTASVALTGAQSIQIEIRVNAVAQKSNLTRGADATAVHTCNITNSQRLAKGDQVTIFTRCNTTTTANTLYNNLTIVKVG